MTTIIVPLDFSEESMRGLDLAVMLANKMSAKIEMVHVIAEVNPIPGSLKNEHNQAEKYFQEIIQKYKDNGPNRIDMSYIIKEGRIHREVANQAASYEDSLIALSTHGKSGFEEFFIGGYAYKITSVSKNPVITIRKKNVPETIKRIVLPLDITRQTREKVPYTLKLAKFFNSQIHVVTVRSTNSKTIEKKLIQYSKQVVTYLENHKIPVKVEHLSGSNLTDITIAYANSISADLISIMSEQESGISNLLLGSYAHQMINYSTIPVLTFPTYQIGIITEDLRTQGVDAE